MRLGVDTRELEAFRGFALTWRLRASSYQRHVVYGVANAVYKDLRKRIPSEASELKKAVRLAAVTSLGDAYVVYLEPKARRVKEEDKDRVILEVSRKRGAFLVPRTVTVLEDHGPWTLDTIPLTPSPRFSVVTRRNVSEFVVREIRKARRKDHYKWKRKLVEAGVRLASMDKRKAISAVPDLALQSMTYEFGLAGVYKPHWRPAILNNTKSASVEAVAKASKISRIMKDPKYKGWRSWPKVRHQIGSGRLKTFQRFQEKLGLLS